MRMRVTLAQKAFGSIIDEWRFNIINNDLSLLWKKIMELKMN